MNRSHPLWALLLSVAVVHGTTRHYRSAWKCRVPQSLAESLLTFGHCVKSKCLGVQRAETFCRGVGCPHKTSFTFSRRRRRAKKPYWEVIPAENTHQEEQSAKSPLY
jgi:hypothetical protein